MELMAMFPEDSLDLESLTPLSQNLVIEEFLFPETIILLLQEELRISIPDILQILQERNVGDVGCRIKVQLLIHVSLEKIFELPLFSQLKQRLKMFLCLSFRMHPIQVQLLT